MYKILGKKLPLKFLQIKSAREWMNKHDIVLHTIYTFPEAMQYVFYCFLREVAGSKSCE